MTRSTSLLLAGLVLGLAAAGSANAQASDTRWQAWVGCWQPVATDSAGMEVEASGDLVCVVPHGDVSVEIATVSGGEIVSRDTVNANGQEMRGPRGTCVGMQVAEWSANATRVYLRSESICPGGIRRLANGLISITPDGEWLDIRGLNSGEAHGVRVQRYRAANPDADGPLPAEITELLATRPDRSARIGAAQSISAEDIIEATGKIEPDVVQAWLVETNQGFFLNGRDLIRMADAGVPASITDVMVALSYSEYFAVDRGKTYHPRPLSEDSLQAVPRGIPVYSIWDPFGPGYYPGYGIGYGRYGDGYNGGGWYPGDVVIVSGGRGRRSDDDGGTVVSGKGYKRREPEKSSTSTSSSERPRETGSTSSSTSSSSSPAPASTESSGSSSGRTAKPRDP